MNHMVERFSGCLFGLAVGDALASRLKGYSPEAIRQSDLGAIEFLEELWSWSRGKWTSNTKMALTLAESIAESNGFVPEQASKRYLEWYEPGDWQDMDNIVQMAVANLKEGASWQESGIKADWAAGNGAAVRVAPIGLLNINDWDKLKKDVYDDSVITHNNHDAINGSFAVAYAIARLAKGDIDIGGLIPETVEFIQPSEVIIRLEIAQKLFEQGVPADSALLDLGTKNFAVETVASAFFCFISSPDSFESVVYNAIRGGNDTIATAMIAGALSGAYLGLESIPLTWREEIEGSLRIERLAEQIYGITI